jgi:uncharacterized protein YfeS
MGEEISFINAHPKAQKLMQDDFYYSVTDQIAPFGDDDSWETFRAFREWFPNNNDRDKLEFIYGQLSYWGYPPFDLSMTEFDEVNNYLKLSPMHDRYLYGAGEAVIATAFGQLYIEGKIDLNIRNFAIAAIKRQTLPEMIAMYSEQQKDEIAEKYNKLLSVLMQDS